jgi:N-acetylmuramoyl-L-alanine amidase
MKLAQLMIRSKSLPLYLKRSAAVFLICSVGYFLTDAGSMRETPDTIDNTINTVVIDAGHGGKDPGAMGRISKEKDLALKIALKVGSYIEENVPDVQVIYTRKTDEFIGLNERATIANSNDADLFISVHVNANTNTSPAGTSSHVLGLHRAEENFDVALRENSVIMLEEDYETTYQGFDPESWESYVIFSVMQNTFLKQSIEFASYVQDQFRDRAMRKDRGVKQQGLLVLARSAMPGVLIETGFITNENEERFLNTENGQDIIASAIYRAFKQYKSRIEGRSNFTLETAAPRADAASAEGASLIADTDGQLVFCVQVAALRNRVDPTPDHFNGYRGIEVIDDGRAYKYVINEDFTYHQALERCSIIKKDFPGAFVIAVKNGAIVPLADALKEINK